MAVKIAAPKGVKDVLPSESYKWHYVENSIRDICALYGFNEVRTPTFEHTELFLRGVGDTTDVVQKEMYTFEDKGGRSITLRPEGTAGAARCFIEHGLAGGPQPVKMYYLPLSVFRYENPQAGRLREHHQFGVEMFGAKEPTADAEVILLALNVIKRMGINNLSLNINSIGCPKCRPEYNKALVAYFEEHKSELCPTCLERLYKNPLRILDCKEDKCKTVAKDAPLITENLCEECKDHFSELQALLGTAGVEFKINPFIVRGLDYYTKTVFEIISNEIGAQGTVCGGGRYDGLIKQVGGPEMPGVGFGMGIERLLMVMEGSGAGFPDAPTTDVFIATMGAEARSAGFKLMQELRAAGISADIDHAARSLKAQFKYADKLGAKKVLVLGGDELLSGKAQLRDMENSTQSEILLEDTVRELKK